MPKGTTNAGSPSLARTSSHDGLQAEFQSLASECNQTCVGAVCELVKHHQSGSRDEPLRLNGNQPSLKDHRLDDQVVIALLKALKRHPGVVHSLDLSYNGVTDEGAMHLANHLKDDMSTVALDLTFNDIGQEGAEALFQALQVNIALERLHLSNNRIGNAAIMKLAAALQVSTSLKFIDIDSTDCEVKGIIGLFTVLKRNHHIRGINLGRPLLNPQNDEHIQHLFRMLQVNNGLERIHLSRWGIRDPGAERICKALYVNSTLQHLDLSSNRIGRDGAALLAQYLGTNPRLVSLNLQANRIEDDGAVALAEQLATENNTLERLCVQHNELGDRGLCALAQCMQTNNSLRFLFVWGNNFGPGACESFRVLLNGDVPRLASDGALGGVDVEAFIVDAKPQVAHRRLNDRTGLPHTRDTIKV